MIIKIAFDPDTVKPEDEAYPAFQKCGMLLKVWALYKKHFITSQLFRECLCRLGDAFDRMYDKDDQDAQPYRDVGEFIGLLGHVGLYGTTAGPRYKEIETWAVKYWDHFNLNVQRPIVLEFERVETVTKRMVVAGMAYEGPTPT